MLRLICKLLTKNFLNRNKKEGKKNSRIVNQGEIVSKLVVLLRLRQSLLRSFTIDVSKKNRDVDVDSMSQGHVD